MKVTCVIQLFSAYTFVAQWVGKRLIQNMSFFKVGKGQYENIPIIPDLLQAFK